MHADAMRLMLSNAMLNNVCSAPCVFMQMQDEFLKRLAEDTVLYVRTVCNTIIMEVPKAIVHCQVGSCC
jgi:hypothetical protein